MSLPRQIPPSPSKSSLRSTSGAKNPTAPRSLLPSPHFEEPLPQSLGAQSRGQEYDDAVEEESEELEPSAFQPFFTLIEDGVLNEHHHPTIHYIFADDDTDIITEAACRSLAQDTPTTSTATANDRRSTHPDTEHEDSKLPHPALGVREHYLLLDVHPSPSGTGTGFDVASAHSLSSEWQVTNTTITHAPTIDGAAADAEDGLMLKIEGRGGTPPDENNRAKDKDKEKEKESLEDLVEVFQKRLADIKRTMEAAGDVGDIGRLEQHLAE